MVMPSVLVTDKSACGVRVSVSVAELSVLTVSVKPIGALMVAVLARLLVAPGERAAITVKVTVPPAGMVTLVAIEPEPVAWHDAPTEAAHVQAALVMVAGNVSVTGTPVAVDGPVLATTMV